MCSIASRDACKHHCLLPHPYVVVSLEGKLFARRPNLMCVPEVSVFGQWLDHFLPVTAGHSSYTLTPVLLAWMSPAAYRRFQILFPKNVLTKNILEIVMSVGVKYEIGQEADRNGNEGNVSAQRRIPSLCKQKMQNQGKKRKIFPLWLQTFYRAHLLYRVFWGFWNRTDLSDC